MTAKSVKQQLVGTWLLCSAVWTRLDGTPLEAPAGAAKGVTNGILMLDRTGHFSFQLVSDARPQYKLINRPDGTPAEPKGVATRVIACFGTYSVNKEDNKDILIFHVVGHSLPKFEGGVLKRTIIKLAGDELTDSNPETSWKAKSTIVWKRAK